MKKFLAVLLALAVLVLFPIVLVSTLTLYRLFTPSTIKHVIRASEVGENLPTVVLSFMEQSQEAESNGETEIELDPETTKTFISAAFAPETVYGLTDAIVDAIGRWWGTNQPIEQLDLELDLSKAKQQLAPAINEQFGVYTQELPLCDGTIPTGSSELDFSTMFNITCVSAGSSFGDAMTGNIPNTVNAQELLQQQIVATGGAAQLTFVNQQVDQYRLYWKWLHWLVWIGWGTIGLFLLFIVLLRLRPGFAPFGWLGWLHVLMTIEVAPILLVVWLAPQFLLPWISGTFDTAIVDVIQNALTALFAVYLWPLLWVTIGTFVSIIIWFMIRAVVKHHGAQKTIAPKT